LDKSLEKTSEPHFLLQEGIIWTTPLNPSFLGGFAREALSQLIVKINLLLEYNGYTMTFSLVRAIKSTHKHPVNRILHCIGLVVYAIGIMLIVGYFVGSHTNPITGITLWLMAIGMFLIGHKLEGNLRAMTLIIFFKYLKSRKGMLARL
jgi:hypothetical protein